MAWLPLHRVPLAASLPLLSRAELPPRDPDMAEELSRYGIPPLAASQLRPRRPGKAGMNPHHHPSEEMLLAYAAGTLQEPQAVVLASHAALCPQCSAALARCEAVGGALLEALPREAVSDGLRSKVLARLDDEAPTEPADPRRASSDPLVPLPLERHLGGPLSTVAWRHLSPGVRHRVLLRRDWGGAHLQLLRIAAGRFLPRHGRRGTELVLVLSGSFVCGAQRYQCGDVAEFEDDHLQQAQADPGTDCICLVATDGPLKFERPVARATQPSPAP